jgi:hypothetical protein
MLIMMLGVALEMDLDMRLWRDGGGWDEAWEYEEKDE